MIKLIQFPPALGLPNASGFCLKLETWLRMAGLPYENVYSMNLGRAPKGKMPYIVDDDGTTVADSGLIIEHLTRRHGVRLDSHLDASGRAQSLLLQRTLEEHAYWCVLYFRWADERFWPATRAAFFGGMRAPLKWFVPDLARKGMLQQVKSVGVGRHSPDEITEMGMRDIAAIATVLGDKPFLFGQPSTADASAYGMLANVVFVDLDLPFKSRIEREHPSIVRYCERMREVYWRG
ncbi:glutathione S-transferase family protein [Methyloversatilis thermotolerans]|uniref:glutathione S-transferase family protein n=1 Tax=Methyloversatilis thermotolerans TaxID=1346290 RepID=UPI00037E1D2F|nr:glutathione S-transferase family protein [Methyloversatilis thermotolerans]